jgi:hypothetical protein
MFHPQIAVSVTIKACCPVTSRKQRALSIAWTLLPFRVKRTAVFSNSREFEKR